MVLYVLQEWIVEPHMPGEAHSQGNDVAREVHAQLKVTTQVNAKGLPDRGEHPLDDVPDLIGNQGLVAFWKLPYGASSGKVKRYVCDFVEWRNNSELRRDLFGDGLCGWLFRRAHYRGAGLIVEGDEVPLAHATDRDGDVDDKVLKCHGADSQGAALEYASNALL